MKLFFNGRLLDEDSAAIAPNDRGFTLGDGLYETIRAKDGQPLRLAAHLARLRAGADALGIPLPAHDIATALGTLLDANRLLDVVFRLTLTRGPAPRGLATPRAAQPTLLITCNPPVGLLGPARAIIAQVTRRNEHSPLARFKTLNALDNILARREAEERRADDALLLNTIGHVAESTVANLFLVIDGRCTTPPVSDGALPGVLRAELIERLDARVHRVKPAGLFRATEAFLSNANGIRPLIAVDGAPIGNGQPGPLTVSLMAALS